MTTLFAFMLGQLEISNFTAALLVLVAIVFVGSFMLQPSVFTVMRELRPFPN